MFGEILPPAEKGGPILADHWEALRTLLMAHAPHLFAQQSIMGASNRRPPERYIPRLAWATTSAAVATTDSTFTVTDIVNFDGSAWQDADPLTVKNDPDEFEIASATRGKIIYCFDDDGVWAWHPLDFPC